MYITLKEFWKDDSGGAGSSITTELMLIAIGVALVSFVLAGVFISTSVLGTSVGDAIKNAAP